MKSNLAISYISNNVTVSKITDVKTFKLLDIDDRLKELKKYYSNFEFWFSFTFLKSLNGKERTILAIYENDYLSGLSFLKNTNDEKKICTFYIFPEFRGNGYGDQLMKESLKYLGHKDILITLDSSRKKFFEKLLYKNNFLLIDKINGLYGNDKTELFYRSK